MVENPVDLLLHKKPIGLFIALLENSKESHKFREYASTLSKKVDLTYSHAVRTLQVFKKFGYVDFEKKGRIKMVELTPKGLELAEQVDKLYRLLHK